MDYGVGVSEELGVRWSVVDYSDVRVLRVVGEMDVLMAGVQEQEFTSTVAQAPTERVLVDMTAVDFCDSTGIGVLVRAARPLWADGRSLELVGVQPYILRQFTILGLDEHFPCHDDLGQAGVGTS